MTKYMITFILFALLLAFSVVAVADLRFELRAPGGAGAGGSVVHIPYDQNDADLEFKFNPGADKMVPSQQANGSYNVEFETIFRNVSERIANFLDVTQMDDGIESRTTIYCRDTAGVFVDDQGNTYSSNSCFIKWRGIRGERNNRYKLSVRATLRNASLDQTEQTTINGMSIMMK